MAIIAEMRKKMKYTIVSFTTSDKHNICLTNMTNH